KTWRYCVASGIWNASSQTWAAPLLGPQVVGAPVATGGGGGFAPNIWDLLSNNHEPNSVWDEEKQANDLTASDLLSDYVDVDFARLAQNIDDPDPQRTGVLERICVSSHPTAVGHGIEIDRALGTNFVYEGPWQP